VCLCVRVCVCVCESVCVNNNALMVQNVITQKHASENMDVLIIHKTRS